MKPGEIVIARLHSGDTYARYIGAVRGSREHVVDSVGALMTVRVAYLAPKAVQS